MKFKKILQPPTEKLRKSKKMQKFLQNFRFPLAFLRKMWYNIPQMPTEREMLRSPDSFL